MNKYIQFFLKPSKLLLISPLLFLAIFFVSFATTIENISAFISGASTGIFASLFWLVYIQAQKNNGPFFSPSLLFSLPVDRKTIIKSWFIANQLAFVLLFCSVILALIVVSFINPLHDSAFNIYASIIVLALISLILFNLQTPLSFYPLSKMSVLLNALLFLFGIFAIPLSQIVFLEYLKSTDLKVLYLITLVVLYGLTTLLTYKKSLKLIEEFKL